MNTSSRQHHQIPIQLQPLLVFTCPRHLLAGCLLGLVRYDKSPFDLEIMRFTNPEHIGRVIYNLAVTALRRTDDLSKLAALNQMPLAKLYDRIPAAIKIFERHIGEIVRVLTVFALCLLPIGWV
jgi:hypothetical protein